MHILWVKTELLHPVDKGGKIRTYQMLRELAKHHQISYATLDDGAGGPLASEQAAEYCHRLLRVPFDPPRRNSAGFYLALAANLFSSLPYAITRYRSPQLLQTVADTLAGGGIDVVVADFLVSSVNLPRGVGCGTVLFQHNVEAEIWRRRGAVAGSAISRGYYGLQWGRMQAFERAACARFDRVAAVSENDAEHLRRSYGCDRVVPVPTGVDTEYFSPAPFEQREPRSLVFTGTLDWMPNEDGMLFFLSEVMPALRERVPGVTVTIVGREPTARLTTLAARYDDVRLAGRVPDVRPYLARAGASIVPLRVGGGTRLKIYEAMAMGAPVISTSIGAEGLPLLPGEHFVLADDPATFAEACARVLLDRGKARQLGDAGAAFVHGNCGWSAAATAFESVCEAAMRAARERGGGGDGGGAPERKGQA